MFSLNKVAFSYGRANKLFREISIDFRSGKTLLLGPNGAGKSTLFSLMSGWYSPTSGSITIDGKFANSSTLKRRVAVLPQVVPIIPGFSAFEQLSYVGWLAGLSTKMADQRSAELLKLIGLENKAKVKASKLSGGQLRRLGIAFALIGEADVVLLDEPTAGLDLGQKARFYRTLDDVPSDKTVVVSSHEIESVSNHFDHVVVINQGRLLYLDSMQDFLKIGFELGAEDNNSALVAAYESFVGSEDD